MYLIEAVLFSAAIFAVNYIYYPLSLFFIGEPVNPYQVLSLFMSIRYGSIRGFVAYIVIMIAGCANAILNNQGDRLADSQVVYFGLAVLLISHVAGQLADYHGNELFFIKDKYEQLNADFQKCTLNYLMLAEANKELTQKIVNRFQSMSTVYEAAQKLETLSKEELFPAVLGLFEHHAGVKAAAIYEAEGEIMKLRGKYGAEVIYPETIDPAADKMVKNSIAARKTLSQREDIFDLSKEFYSDDHGSHLITAPIFAGDQAAGVVIIEKISFENFTDSTIRMISMIADWTGMCLNKIQHFSRMEAEVPVDQNINCYKLDHLKRMIKTEIAKAVRYRLQLSICKVSVQDGDRISEKMKNSVYYTLAYILKNSVRDIDFYGACMENGSFIIILPVTDSGGAGILMSRLTKEISSFKIKPYGNDEEDLRVDAAYYSLFEIMPEERIKSIPFDRLRQESEAAYGQMIGRMKI